MTEEQINESLCVYDPRNPSYEELTDSLRVCGMEDEIPPPRREGCGCDNCFTGRDALAVELLKRTKIIKDFACEMAVSYSEPRLRYYELQVACSAYEDFKAFADSLTEEKKEDGIK